MAECKDAENQHNIGYEQLHKSISIIPQKPPNPLCNLRCKLYWTAVPLCVTSIVTEFDYGLVFSSVTLLTHIGIEPKPLSLFHEPASYCMSRAKSWLSVGD